MNQQIVRAVGNQKGYSYDGRRLLEGTLLSCLYHRNKMNCYKLCLTCVLQVRSIIPGPLVSFNQSTIPALLTYYILTATDDAPNPIFVA